MWYWHTNPFETLCISCNENLNPSRGKLVANVLQLPGFKKSWRLKCWPFTQLSQKLMLHGAEKQAGCCRPKTMLVPILSHVQTPGCQWKRTPTPLGSKNDGFDMPARPPLWCRHSCKGGLGIASRLANSTDAPEPCKHTE